MTTLITTTNNSMPKVSYIKGLDVFLNFCFIMVFSSLVEYAVVSYWNKRQARRRDKQKRTAGPTNEIQSARSPVGEFPMFMNYSTMPSGGLSVPSPNAQSYVYRPPGILPSAAQMLQSNQQQITSQAGAQNSLDSPPDCDCRTAPLMCIENETCAMPFQTLQHPQLGSSSSLPSYTFTMGSGRKLNRKNRRPYSYYGHHERSCCRISCSPSKIDRCSRLWFPVIFIVFNIFYWFAMTTASQFKMQSINYVPFKS